MTDQPATSRLGFGTAGITTVGDRAAAVRVLEAAFDAGITHFDTARLYGYGHSEGIVGEFLRGRRDAVTVATKFGLEPPSGTANNATLVAVAKKVLRHVPFVADRLRRRAHGMVKGGQFTPDAAERSLEKSLAELKTDHVDLLLLHECSMADAQSEELIRFLETQITRGTVRELGVATDARQLGGDVTALSALYRVVQLQDNVLDPWIRSLRGASERTLITHSALKPLPAIADAARKAPTVVRRWSAMLGADLADSTTLARFLLAHALAENPTGRVLFATTRAERVAPNVRGVDSLDAARQFPKFVEELLGSTGGPTSRG